MLAGKEFQKHHDVGFPAYLSPKLSPWPARLPGCAYMDVVDK